MNESGVSPLILRDCLGRESISDGPRQAAINVILTRLFCMMWGGGHAYSYNCDSDGISSRMYKHFFPSITPVVFSSKRNTAFSKADGVRGPGAPIANSRSVHWLAISTVNYMGPLPVSVARG